ncbi:MAG: hypothetical protein GY928_14850 [Colwellia sp.]|nr:hypothetical protein [Colwellia sp.]
MEEIRKARKEYKCDVCNGIIRKGNKYVNRKYKTPRYDKNENQIGIEYLNHKTHIDYCGGLIVGMKAEEAKLILQNCRRGKHNYIEAQVFDHYVGCWPVGGPTGEYFCEWCGKQLK